MLSSWRRSCCTKPPEPPCRRSAALLRILVHTIVIIGLYLAFSFALFLGLQVNPLYGNIGVLACAGLAAFYVYIGFLRR